MILWLLGVVGCLLNRRHLILMLMCVELMLLGACILFLGLAGTIDNLGGQVFTLFILTVAAAESSVGLAILIAHYRKRATIAKTHWLTSPWFFCCCFCCCFVTKPEIVTKVASNKKN